MLKITLAFGLLLPLAAMAEPVPATETVQVPVLVRSLAAGDSFKGATELRDVEKAKVFAGTVRDDSELAHAVAGRQMTAGKPVLRIHVKQDFAVDRNSTVSFTLKRGGIMLTGTGTALEDGEIGSTIKILNVATRSTMLAQVVGEGQVEIR